MRKIGMIALSLMLALLVLSAIFLFPSSTKSGPQAVRGVLDASDWNFATDGVIRLEGEWEFYRKQLLTPEDFKTTDRADKLREMKYVHVPNPWEDVNDGEGTGYATYRLQIKLPKEHSQLFGIKHIAVKGILPTTRP
ncbi:hypothetical protein AAFJ72_03525 [Brevibacillus gelatini]|uniref:hypothetical protein n=1 Tax=Brevibacillus gelatini TaxID=1655277 RepID=UPI003D815978